MTSGKEWSCLTLGVRPASLALAAIAGAFIPSPCSKLANLAQSADGWE